MEWSEDAATLAALIDKHCISVLKKDNDTNISPTKTPLTEFHKYIENHISKDKNIKKMPFEIKEALEKFLSAINPKINRIGPTYLRNLPNNTEMQCSIFNNLNLLNIDTTGFKILCDLSHFLSSTPTESDLTENLAIKATLMANMVQRANSETKEKLAETPLRTQSVFTSPSQYVLKQIPQMIPDSPTTKYIESLDKQFPLKMRISNLELRPLLFAAFSRQLEIGNIVAHCVSTIDKPTPFVHPSVKTVWNMTGEAIRTIKFTMQKDPDFKKSIVRQRAFSLLNGQLVEFASDKMRTKLKELIKFIVNSPRENIAPVTERLDACIERRASFVSAVAKFVAEPTVNLQNLPKLNMPELNPSFGTYNAKKALKKAVDDLKKALLARADERYVHQFMLRHINDDYFERDCIFKKQTPEAVLANFVMFERGEIKIDDLCLDNFEGECRGFLHSIRNLPKIEDIFKEIDETQKITSMQSDILMYMIGEPSTHAEVTRFLLNKGFSVEDQIIAWKFFSILVKSNAEIILDEEIAKFIVEYLRSLPRILYSGETLKKPNFIILAVRASIVLKAVRSPENSVLFNNAMEYVNFISFSLIPPLFYAPFLPLEKVAKEVLDSAINTFKLEDAQYELRPVCQCVRQYIFHRLIAASVRHTRNLIEMGLFIDDEFNIKYASSLINLAILQIKNAGGSISEVDPQYASKLDEDLRTILINCPSITRQAVSQAMNEIFYDRPMSQREIKEYEESKYNKGRTKLKVLEDGFPIYTVQPNAKGPHSGLICVVYILKNAKLTSTLFGDIIRCAHKMLENSTVFDTIVGAFNLSQFADDELKELIKQCGVDKIRVRIQNELYLRLANRIVPDLKDNDAKEILLRSMSHNKKFPRFPLCIVARCLSIPTKVEEEFKLKAGNNAHKFPGEYVTVSSPDQCIARFGGLVATIREKPRVLPNEFISESLTDYTLHVVHEKATSGFITEENIEYAQRKIEEFEGLWEQSIDAMLFDQVMHGEDYQLESQYPSDFIECRRAMVIMLVELSTAKDLQKWNIQTSGINSSAIVRQIININRSRKAITVNRFKAFSGEKPLIMQLKEHVENKALPLKCLCQNDRVWRVDLEGENATDAGGPGREVYQEAFNEFIKGVCNVFIMAPNNKYLIPNPRANKKLLQLAGALIASLIPMGQKMPLNLPLFVYKGLAGKRVTLADVALIDDNIKDIVDATRYLELSDYSESLRFTFVVPDIDGKPYELCDGGSSTIVTPNKIRKFRKLLMEKRCGELDVPIEAMREGFLEVVGNVPISGSTIMELVQALPGLSEKEFLKAARFENDYEGAIVDAFKDAIALMSCEERSDLFKFATGLALPPINSERFLKITVLSGEKLPAAATCFNTLYIPCVKDKNRMLKMLRCSIKYGSLIEDGNFDTHMI